MFLNSLVRREPICIIFCIQNLEKNCAKSLGSYQFATPEKNVTTVRCTPDLMHLTNVALLS